MTEGCNGCEFLAEDETCGALDCNGMECPDLPCEHYWIFTFGCGQEHRGKYVKIRGTFDQARQKMCEKYNDKWAFQYSEEEWDRMKNDPDRCWDMETELEVIE